MADKYGRGSDLEGPYMPGTQRPEPKAFGPGNAQSAPKDWGTAFGTKEGGPALRGPDFDANNVDNHPADNIQHPK